MRDHAIITPKFWNGKTGRQLRQCGTEELLVALYLMTCPSSNMIGLYYLPIPVISHETGLPIETASKALQRVCEAQLAMYDEENEIVFLPEMARYQIGESMSAKDNRVKFVRKLLDQYSKSFLINEFHARYDEAFNLEAAPKRKAPQKPLRSQDQDQDQEQDLDLTPLPPAGELFETGKPDGGEAEPEPDPEDVFVEVWNGLPGVRSCSALTAGRRKHLRARLRDRIRGRPWLDVLRDEAPKHFPLKCFGSGEWKPDVTWILKPDNLTKIIEGKYDWQRTNNGRAAAATGPGQVFDEAGRHVPGGF